MATDDTTTSPETPTNRPLDFIRQIVADDLSSGRHGHVVTRFPPEPNGYLHIGHAKSICVNFGIARDAAEGRLGGAAGDGASSRSQGREALGLEALGLGGQSKGRCHLRFDDTNPTKEDREYIEAIKRDVRWLGFDWGEHLYHASDYFQQLYDWAVLLIKAGKAYVDDQSADAIRDTRGTLTAPGRESPHRNRSSEENLALFERMKAGEFPDGSKVLRAKIDMSSPNVNLRDPVMYRILHATHPHAGDQWCIYPMYDWAHGQSDWIEGVTHSLCTLEFEAHRPLYDWFVQAIIDSGGSVPGAPQVNHRPRQIEFARLNLTHTVMSKRKLLLLVKEGHVAGWDDPRMPTISGMRRRGYPPAALRDFCDAVGNSKRPQTIELSRLEHHVRECLNMSAPRVMGVLEPLKVVITNHPEGETELLDAVNNPEDASAGTRQVPFSRELWIEREDFLEDPPKKFFRLGPGREVRLRWGYFITCRDYKKDAAGNVVELHCTYDPETRGGQAPDGRKVKGTIHWVSAAHALDAQVRLYDTLFAKENAEAADEGKDWRDNFNPDSLVVLTGCKVEPSLAEAKPGVPYQFERKGYFVLDEESPSGADSLIFNRTVGLKDTWAKVQNK